MVRSGEFTETQDGTVIKKISADPPAGRAGFADYTD